MTQQIYLEERTMKSMTRDSQDVPPPGYYVVVDGKRSPLIFDRRQAEAAVAAALASN